MESEKHLRFSFLHTFAEEEVTAAEQAVAAHSQLGTKLINQSVLSGGTSAPDLPGSLLFFPCHSENFPTFSSQPWNKLCHRRCERRVKVGGCRAEETPWCRPFVLPRCCGCPSRGGGWHEEPPLSLGSCAGLCPCQPLHGSPLTLFVSRCRVWLGNKREKMAQPCWFRTKWVF